MNAKKLLALLLALVLCLSTLAACNSDPKETTQVTTKATEGTTAATTAATTEATEPKPLTHSDRYPIDFSGTLTAVTTKTDGDTAHNYLLMEELTGIDIVWTVSASEQVPLMFVGGGSDMPDIFFNAAGIKQSQIKDYGAAGMLINFLDPDILDKMPNLKAAYEADPKLFDAVKDAAGAAYALPYYCYSLTTGGNLFYVLTDMTKKAGWEELPSTIEDFLKMCEDLKTYYADVEGYVPMVSNGGKGVTYNGAYASFFFPAFGELMETGITVTLDGQNIQVGFATEQYKNYITFMHTLYKNGYLDHGCFEVEANTDKARTISKTTTMNPFATYLEPANFENGELDFQVMPPLTSAFQSEARWAIPSRYKNTTFMISSSCKDIDAACAFFDAMYATEENPIKDKNGVSAWGISIWLGECGEDFIINKEDNTYTILDHEGFDNASTWLSSAGHGAGAYIDWPYVEDSGTGLMVKALGIRDILEPKGVNVLSSSLLILTQDEKDIYNDSWTDITTKVTEMNAAFITGQADIETEWDNYIKTLNAMGLQDVIDVYQAALDRYNAG